MDTTQKKIMILNYSLQLEKVASLSLAYILDIENTTKSKSLGNTNSTLSFNQKTNLLLDSKSIESEEKMKLEFFMSVRNQFMHNLDVNTFTDAYSLLKGTEKKLRLIYPEYFTDEVNIEESLQKCTERLYTDNLKSLASFKGAKETKIALISKKHIYERLYNNLSPAIDKALDELKKAIIDKEFDYQNKEQLFENIDILKMQIITYQSLMKNG